MEKEVKACYIHIPFCRKICSYCDFCKMFYRKEWASYYLEALKFEIEESYLGDKLTSIYIGGGTPSSLDRDDLEQLFFIIDSLRKDEHCEFTFECNVEDITDDLLLFLKCHGVNRLSIGVQTFHEKYLRFMNRSLVDSFSKIVLCQKYFSNISIDLMYGINGETLEELEEDLATCLRLDVQHVSIYGLILEENTMLKVNGYVEEDDGILSDMYDLIRKRLKEAGYLQYEVSNFSKEGFSSRHNLVYWNNDEYYGFGLGASGYVRKERYENTRSFNAYLGHHYVLEKHVVTLKENMENEMILNLRKVEGVSKSKFYSKFKKEIRDVFDISRLSEKGDYFYIPEEYFFVQNSILVDFLL